jgi:hypothetical protein
MRKLIYFLVVLLFLIGISYGYYDDFSGYESYYKLIDDCEVTTGWAPDTGSSNLTISSGGKINKAIRWDKSDTGTDLGRIKGDNIYGSSPKDISAISNGYLTFWYYITSGDQSGIKRVEGMLSSESTALTNIRTMAYQQGLGTFGPGWNYFKQPLCVSLGDTQPDYSSIKSIAVCVQTSGTGVTATGLMIDDIRVVSINNTTNGAWNEASGVWSIFDDAGNKVYYQTSSCDIANPPFFTKTQYKDFIYTAKVRVIETNTNYCGIIFRYQPTTKYYYLFNLKENATNPDYIELKKVAGTPTNLAVVTVASGLGTPPFNYWLKVICVGNSIKAYTSVDGSNYTERFNITDTSLLSPGYIGLLTDKPGYFDDIKVLPIPSGVTASGGDKKVKISWNSYSYSGEIASYNVYRSETSGGPYTKVGTTSSINYTDTDVTNGTTYYYKITANVNVGGTTEETEIDLSSEVSATPHPGIAVSNNPFTPNSSNPAFQRVTFTVYNPTNELIELKVYQPTGVLINTITVNGGSTISWDGTNSSGGVVEGGVYVYQIKVGGSVIGNGSVILAK